jgi:Aspartyl protease
MFVLKKSILYTLLCLATISQMAVCQKTTTVIPFQLTAYNNISIRAVINQKDTVQLMFHTAASDVTLTEAATKKLMSLVFDKAIDGIKSWGGSTNEARVSSNNSIQIAGLSWDKVSITENKNSGPQTDGKFGIDLFKGKVIQIDFEKQQITLSNKLPGRLKKYEKLKLTTQNEMLFVEAGCEVAAGSRLQNKFLIHSGYAGSILLDDKFANDNQLGDILKIIDEKELKDSYGNVLKVKKAILPILTIGNQSLTDVPVGFFAGALGRQKISSFGGDILKRFSIIIDAKREFIYLKTNRLNSSKYANV